VRLYGSVHFLMTARDALDGVVDDGDGVAADGAVGATDGLEARMQFTTTVLQARKTATGLPVPSDLIEALGSGKRPAVVVTLDGGYTYRSTVGVMNEQFLVPLSAEHREASGVAAGDSVVVTLTLDTLPRTVDLPEDLAAAFAEAGVRAAFDTLSASRQRALVDPVTQAKAPETRARRVAKAVESLQG
jgi:hypothetical protein